VRGHRRPVDVTGVGNGVAVYARKLVAIGYGRRFRRWETPVLVAATLVAVLHALDDAFLNRQPSVPLGQHAPAALISVAAAAAAIVAFPRSRPGVRAAIALVFGVLALVNGALHLVHVTDVETSGSDVTGILAVAAGITLLVLGLAIPFVHRGEGAATGARRWGYRVAVVVVGALIVYAFLFPMSGAIVQTHKYREPIGAPPSDAYEPVSFNATDGLELSGWYRTSRNRAAIVLVHGGGGDRTGAVRHAELLGRDTGMASSSTTPAAAARARAAPSGSAGAGPGTSGARSRFSANAPTSTPSGSAGSGCPPEPTSSSRSPPRSAT
jgi:hypothetical protein